MPELGKKYECAECGAKFYDLGKAEPICPRCGTNQRDVEKTAAPEPRARYVAPKAAAPAPALDTDEDVPADIGDEDEEILEVEPGEEDEEEEEDDEE